MYEGYTKGAYVDIPGILLGVRRGKDGGIWKIKNGAQMCWCIAVMGGLVEATGYGLITDWSSPTESWILRS